MIFTIIDNSNKINKKEEVNKITKKNNDLIYKEYFNGLKFDIVFLYGGDGTYLEFIRNNIDNPIKIVLMDSGKLSFLNSSYNYEKINLNNFQEINYLEYFDGIDRKNFINECEIMLNRISKFQFLINELMFKDILSSRFFITTAIGSTGLARSRNYPLLLNNNNYIFDVLDEPRYNYYRSLSQPLLLSIKQDIILKTTHEIECILKVDNDIIIKTFVNEIRISNKTTICSIYNAYDLTLLSKKIGELF